MQIVNFYSKNENTVSLFLTTLGNSSQECGKINMSMSHSLARKQQMLCLNCWSLKLTMTVTETLIDAVDASYRLYPNLYSILEVLIRMSVSMASLERSFNSLRWPYRKCSYDKWLFPSLISVLTKICKTCHSCENWLKKMFQSTCVQFRTLTSYSSLCKPYDNP